MNDILTGKNESTAVELDPHSGNRQGMIDTMAKRIVRMMGSQLGRQSLRGVLGGSFGGEC